MSKLNGLCDVCPQPMSKRPCTDCAEVRLAMHQSAIKLEQKYDLRHKHMNGLNTGITPVQASK